MVPVTSPLENNFANQWFREVLNEAPKKCATDHWSNHLISAARLITGLPDGLTISQALNSFNLEG